MIFKPAVLITVILGPSWWGSHSADAAFPSTSSCGGLLGVSPPQMLRRERWRGGGGRFWRVKCCGGKVERWRGLLRREGDCWYNALVDTDLLANNLNMDYAPFYRTFEKCQEFNCLSMLVNFNGSPPRIFMKNVTPSDGSRTRSYKDAMVWYPECK
ncbi:hypothetical protein FHG87_016670 [Trinorchestia longiramus]|nr:hypothetical protein FHG87_016670 [Trinorchestia longiramus]